MAQRAMFNTVGALASYHQSSSFAEAFFYHALALGLRSSFCLRSWSRSPRFRHSLRKVAAPQPSEEGTSNPLTLTPDACQLDPLSIIGVVESSLALALQLATVAKSLGDIAGKYKNAKLTVKALAQNLDVLQLTWTQIGRWFEAYAEDEVLCDDDLIRRVKGFLETGTLVMEALEQDLLAYNVETLNFKQRSKLIWNESTLEGHQIRIRDQTLSMNLFLQAMKLPTPKARATMLQESNDQFRKSNESAYSSGSIILSQQSSSTNQRYSFESTSQESLEYRPLSFENKLFMSKVYIRNSKNLIAGKIHGFRGWSKGKKRIQPLPSLEAIRNELDAETSILLSQDVPTKDEEFGYWLQPDRSLTPFFEQLLLGIANYINKDIAPCNVQELTPTKLAAFYRLVGGDLDPFFLDTAQVSLSFIYQTLGCYHTLQPAEDPYTPPTLPALTSAGFVRFQTIQLLLDPEDHGYFLQEAVRRFELTNPVSGALFPSKLPKESLPCQPDKEMVDWYNSVAEKLNSEASKLEHTHRGTIITPIP